MTYTLFAQKFVDDRTTPAYSDENITSVSDACNKCVSGGCCVVEGPISLTPLDVVRYASSMNVTLEDFMLNWTQDVFPEDAVNERAVSNPSSPYVTFLRRKTKFASSACIFQGFTKDSNGRPKSTCMNYAARSVACREFDQEACRSTSTNEMGTMIAALVEENLKGNITLAEITQMLDYLENQEGMKSVNDVGIQQATIDANKDLVRKGLLSKLELMSTRWSISEIMLRHVLIEAIPLIKYYSSGEQRPAVYYRLSDYQHPIKEKVERLLEKFTTPLDSPDSAVKVSDFREAVKGDKFYYPKNVSPRDERSWYWNTNTLPLDVGIRYVLTKSWPIDSKLEQITQSKIKDITTSLNMSVADKEIFQSLASVFNNLLGITTWFKRTKFILEDSPYHMSQELGTLFTNCFTSEFMRTYFLDNLKSAYEYLEEDLNTDSLDEGESNLPDLLVIRENRKYLAGKNYVEDEGLAGTVSKMVAEQSKDIRKFFSMKNLLAVIKKCNSSKYDQKAYEDLYDLVCTPRWYVAVGVLTEEEVFDLYWTVSQEWNPVLNSQNTIDAYNVITHVGYGINLYSRKSVKELLAINPKYQEILTWINSFAWDRVYQYMKEQRIHHTDPETISEFLDATHSNLGFSTEDTRYKEVLDIVLSKIEPDGSVNSDTYDASHRFLDGLDEFPNLFTNQDEYVYAVYHSAWTVLDGLRSHMDSVLHRASLQN